MNNANKTNEEAANLLEKHLDLFAGTTQWVFTLAIAALRAAPPATGAREMREAARAILTDILFQLKHGAHSHAALVERVEMGIAALDLPLPAPEVRECHGCKHWTISPYARDFEKQNQYGYCRGMRACGVEIETTGDCSVDAIGTDATFSCKGWEAR